MRFREVRTRERITDLDERRKDEKNNYLKIKPEVELSTVELLKMCNDIWKAEINNAKS